MPHFYAQPFNHLATERNGHEGYAQRQYSLYLRHAGVYPPYCDFKPFKSCTCFFVHLLAYVCLFCLCQGTFLRSFFCRLRTLILYVLPCALATVRNW